MPDEIRVDLRPITRENWEVAVELQVREDQCSFVAPNVYSIAESKFYPEMTPLGIYLGDKMVGFTMYGYNEEDSEWWVIRLMIDAAHQGKGYGRAAMREVIQRISQRPDCDAILVSFEPHNHPAEALYSSLGFEHTGRIEEGELVLRLRMRSS